MVFAQINGASTCGLNGSLICVEVDISNGIPAFDIVGLPDTLVRESRERVRAAIKNSGFEFPDQRITVNLAPADMKKDSSGLDLPIAVGILAASKYLQDIDLSKAVFTSELSLEGKLRGISGILPMVIDAGENNMKEVFLAPENAQEALLCGEMKIYAPSTLYDLVKHLEGEERLMPIVKAEQAAANDLIDEDFADVQGQVVAKRAIEIAAAGGHNLLMIGPPGSGKTMLAKRVPSILPKMSFQEALEVTKIYSIAGLLNNVTGLIAKRPFRHPHHTISDAGLIGGGRIPRPGEVTLSHNGVLFLDELPEFSRQVIEVLRQPMEDGLVTIARVNASISYPAKFMLIAAMNPCPCGYATDKTKECTCTYQEIRRYNRKLSGPLLDRIDIHVHVPRLEYKEMKTEIPAESSKVVRERVEQARNLQRARLKRFGLYSNASMGHKHIKAICKINDEAEKLLKHAFDKMALSARGYDRIIKVAQTIADLAASTAITAEHVAEAIQFRENITRV